MSPGESPSPVAPSPAPAPPPVSETTQPAGNVVSLLSNARQTLSGDSELAGDAPVQSQVKASEAVGGPWDADEETLARLAADVRDAVLAEEDEAAAKADAFWVTSCVRARKGDVARASALLRALVRWKGRLGGADAEGKVEALLRRGLVWSSGARDKRGRHVLHVRLRYADPASYAPADVVRTVALAAEWTLRTYTAAGTHGVVILGDAGDVGLRNLDVRVPRELMGALSRTMPVRVGAFCVMNLPWFVRPVFALASKLLGPKLKARIQIVGRREALEQSFDLDAVPVDANIGGTLHWDADVQAAWVDAVMRDAEGWAPIVPPDEG